MEEPLVGVRWLAPVLLSVLLSSGPPSAGGDEGSASARPLGLELELEAPRPDERVRLPVPLVKVSGRAGRVPLFASDVVIAIDQSKRTLMASGLDVDGDGILGRSRRWAMERGRFPKPHREWTTDPGDTVLAEEVSMAWGLVHGLAARKNRLGVLTFAAYSRIRAGLGAPERAQVAVERIRLVERGEGPDISRALGTAEEMLEAAAPVEGPDPARAILVFSDGRPTVPDGGYWASRRALKVARELGEKGIEVWTIAFGARANAEYLASLARLTGGDLIRREDLPVLASEHALRSLEPQELVIENLTIDRSARAVRVFSDGRFDGFVPLARGENMLEVRALLANGRSQRIRRVVHYEQPESETLEDRRNTAGLLVELRHRTREIGETA